MKFLVVVQRLFHLFLATKACTEIRVTSEDNSVIIGRSMEYMINLMSNIIVEPKGLPYTGTVSQNCTDSPHPMTWKNRYGIAYFDALFLPIGTDGMNTAGLSVGTLLFPGFAKYQEVSEKMCGTPAISSLEFPIWLLGNFGSVKEVRGALENESFPLVFELSLLELHYSITDKTGQGIIIEFTAQGRKVHNNTVGVVTNSPPYDFHMLNLRNYVHLSKYAHDPLVLGKDEFSPFGEGSGLLGMPGDLTPTSRLVRAATLIHFADPVKTSKEAVNLALHIMNTVDIPYGVISNHKHEGFADYTNWIVVKDLTNNALYFRTYEDLTIRVVYLDKVQPGKKLKFKVGSPIGGFKDVTDELKLVEVQTEQ